MKSHSQRGRAEVERLAVEARDENAQFAFATGTRQAGMPHVVVEVDVGSSVVQTGSSS